MGIKALYSAVFRGLEIDLSIDEMERNYDVLMASATLPELEESVVNARYADKKEPEKVAEELGLSVEQINQLESIAIKRLQYYTRKEVLWPGYRDAKRVEPAE